MTQGNLNTISFCVIFLIGSLTIFTDVKFQKIHNKHLALGGLLSIIPLSLSIIYAYDNALYHCINGLIAFIVGFILFKFEFWRGGDAKLFVLYAFLMPIPENSPVPFPCVTSLLACSFILGMIIISPFLLKDILVNHKTIVNALFLPDQRQRMFFAAIWVLLYSWVIFPIYYFARITNIAIIIPFSFILFNRKYKQKSKIIQNFIPTFLKKNWFEIPGCIVLGFLMRLWLAPYLLTWQEVTHSIYIILLSLLASTFMHVTFSCVKEYQDRIPFAPLLFMGCLMSYTPFLTLITHLARR